MRILFMGTPDFAVPSLESLVAAGHTVCGVFTQPDKPRNRGMKLQAPPVKVCALAHNIPVYQPVKLRDGAALALIQELASLSFLGFGATAPTPEWGLMLNEGRTYMAKAPWLMIYPGIAIVICVVVFNMLGDSIRDVLDPRQD